MGWNPDTKIAVTVVNGIFWGNSAGDVDSAFTGSISYCDWQYGLGGGGGTYGNNCISADPQFVDGEYHLFFQDQQYHSPCIDKGDDSVVPTVQVDMEGDPRRKDMLPNEAKSDMGADEYDPNGQGGGAP